jgi:Uma2 family endonuclease
MYIANDVPAREPDLIIVLHEHRSRVLPTALEGPADIAIEIVSPESIERDYGDKFKEYQTAGVQEYWLFDPQRQVADIHMLAASGRYQRLPPDAQGRLWSTLLPDFALDPAVLWREPYPAGLGLLRLVSQMTGVPLAE